MAVFLAVLRQGRDKMGEESGSMLVSSCHGLQSIHTNFKCLAVMAPPNTLTHRHTNIVRYILSQPHIMSGCISCASNFSSDASLI